MKNVNFIGIMGLAFFALPLIFSFNIRHKKIAIDPGFYYINEQYEDGSSEIIMYPIDSFYIVKR